jgi:FMN reductase
MYLVISCSLKPASRSRVLAMYAYDRLTAAGHAAEFVDLADYELPFCDGDACYAHPHVQEMSRKITDAEGILLASPIYNFDVNAAAKNLVELTGRAWTEKVVGFLLAAGGTSSYMAVMGLANSLMLDFRSLVLPRFVYTTGESFRGGRVHGPETQERVQELTESLVRVATALR